ncbi:hypothetical protein ABT093_28870 [Kitasatospora sp. NPDC002551]|uniref:hypothetical protein n=1 Tax=Kitasatospora sp. NPDC002551 TaxID=3154539 RepID=UPI00332B1F8B
MSAADAAGDPAAAAGPAEELTDLDDELAAFRAGRPFIYAPNGNINTGSVHGGQRVENNGVPGGRGDRPVEAHEGPISVSEILDARTGFAEPDWFATALAELDERVLFLHGEPGTGRRTAALNLLHRHSGGSPDLRALDGDENLATWRPTGAGARGYLVHGLLPQHPLGPAVVANLRRLLHDADARMVVLLPHEPERIRALARDLHVTPVRCEPPAPRAVFDARLTAAVPDAARRRRLLDALGPELLDTLLTPELVPAQVAELVATVSTAGDDGPDPDDLRARLSFLAEGEVPELLDGLRDDPDGLAFLLATSVFEGLDHRIVREEADRLLALAAGRLDSVLPEGGDPDGPGPRPSREQPRPNPRFVFRRSLEELLLSVRARRGPAEIRAHSRFTYTVEPVVFTRHRQAEAVLRHVWRQYSELSTLLTEWLDTVPARESDLAVPVGHVMGMAASWGGGRRALRHIRELAGSERAHSRTTAAYALGIAARDLVLAGEVKYHLGRWSVEGGWRLRSTVAFACGSDFGTARPEVALTLLRSAYRGTEGDERQVARAVTLALRALFAAGNQATVFRKLTGWADRPDAAPLVLDVLPGLLWDDPGWFGAQVLSVGEHTEPLLGLVRRALDDDARFDATCRALVGWCRTAAWDAERRTAVETLFTALAQDLHLGVMRLFVEIDNDEDQELPGRSVARYALAAWRHGEQQPRPAAAHPNGGTPR